MNDWAEQLYPSRLVAGVRIWKAKEKKALPGFLGRNIHHRDTEFAEFGVNLIKEIFTLHCTAIVANLRSLRKLAGSRKISDSDIAPAKAPPKDGSASICLAEPRR